MREREDLALNNLQGLICHNTQSVNLMIYKIVPFGISIFLVFTSCLLNMKKTFYRH